MRVAIRQTHITFLCEADSVCILQKVGHYFQIKISSGRYDAKMKTLQR